MNEILPTYEKIPLCIVGRTALPMTQSPTKWSSWIRYKKNYSTKIKFQRCIT